ncbi:MAG: efflux RND transporter periplasmic adaptor subunit [Gammaproteobacteria bacterium]|nr:efflux RND transporter periplasmic adaptor subunit [Gammaproteobacteria bacterium]
MENHPHRRKIYITLFIILAIILYAAFSRKEVSIPVVLHKIDKGIVESTVANTRAGTVKACRRAKLAPAMGGQVASLFVKEGDKVEADQLLLEVWNEDLKAQVKLAETESLAAKQNADEICLLADAAQRDGKRTLTLWKEKLASDEQADKAKTNIASTQAACTTARSRANVSLAQLNVATATLERSRLRAPFAGFIAEINGEIGEYATPSPPGIPTPPAIDIVDTSCLYILAPIDEVDAPSILEGMEARITLDAIPGKHFVGAVRRIAPYVFEAEKQARTVDIEAVFMNEAEYKTLKPGYSADLEIILDARHDVIRVPTEAILDGDKVYVYQADEQTIQRKTIKTGVSNWSFTEILEGLKPNDRVVTSIDREGLADGVRVSVEKAAND